MPWQGTAVPTAPQGARARTRAPTLAAAILGLSAILAVAAAALGILNVGTPTPPGMSLGSKALEIAFAPIMLSFPAVGLIIVRRHPRHLLAWMFLVLGLGAEVLWAGTGYGLYGAVTAPGAVPISGLALWFFSWSWAILGIFFPMLLLLFPTGAPPSPRWWWVAVVGAVGAILQATSDALRDPRDGTLAVQSPFAEHPPRLLLDIVYAVGTSLWVLALVAASLSLVLRYRRARGDERQQIKWFVYVAVFVAAAAGFSSFAWSHPLGAVATGLAAVGAAAIPVAVGVAILRYRLYDIDVVIERTVVYGALSVLLLATYVSGVVILQALLRPITAGSDLAVAGSTLSVVALFQPLRQRIQDLVDRRFYRSKYDAARTLEAFTARLRNDVDLDSVSSDLIGVLHDTVRPAHASVWLRAAHR